LDGVMMGIGFLVVLIALGAMRELVGQGTLFTDMDLLLGPMAADWGIRPLEQYPDVLFMVLPPGAFVGLGLLIALKNGIDNHLKARRTAAEPIVAGSKRVRVTGHVS